MILRPRRARARFARFDPCQTREKRAEQRGAGSDTAEALRLEAQQTESGGNEAGEDFRGTEPPGLSRQRRFRGRGSEAECIERRLFVSLQLEQRDGRGERRRAEENRQGALVLRPNRNGRRAE